jgi:hypothetical protein
MVRSSQRSEEGPVPGLVVECDPEPRRGEVPVRFGWLGHMRSVAEVIDCWESETHRDFRLRGDDGCVYILRHDLRSGHWELRFFRHGQV